MGGKEIQIHQFGRRSKSRAMGTSQVSHQAERVSQLLVQAQGALLWSVAHPALDLHTGPVQPPVLGNLALLFRVWQLQLRHRGGKVLASIPNLQLPHLPFWSPSSPLPSNSAPPACQQLSRLECAPFSPWLWGLGIVEPRQVSPSSLLGSLPTWMWRRGG